MSRFTPVVPAWAGPEEQSWALWRGDRLESLHAPYGWLTLASFEWLPARPGPLRSAPGLWWAADGVAHWNGSSYRLAEGDSEIVGSFDAAQHPFDSQTPAAERRVVESGTVRIELGLRGGRFMIRTRVEQPDELAVPAYPYDPAWVVTGVVERCAPYSEGVATVRPDTVLTRTLVGTVRFHVPSHPGEVVASIEEDGPRDDGRHAFTLAFRDKTSGKTTPLWRFVTVLAEPGSESGPVNAVIDFNRALNYPMAFSPYAVCPAPVVGNTIGAPITAGEMSVNTQSGGTEAS